MELRHDDEERRHVHEVGEDAQNERRLHERLPALEAVAGDGVGDRDDEEGRNDATHRRHEEGVAEPPRIVVLVGLGKEAAEGIEAVPKKVSGASDDAPLFDEYLIFCPTVDSEKYSSWIELTGFSLLFSFGQIHDPEKFFFPFYDLLALFFPSIPCRFLFSRPRTNFRSSDLPSFHLIRSEYCSFALS